MLGLKLIHVSKMGHWTDIVALVMDINVNQEDCGMKEHTRAMHLPLIFNVNVFEFER